MTTDSTQVSSERVDARDKVRGATRYAADDARPGLLHGALVVSPIARGEITRIDTSAARQISGVQLVLAYENIGAFESPGFLMGGGFGVQSKQALKSAQIAFRGQPVALVVADSLEAAREAASLVEVDYAAESFSPLMESVGAQTVGQAASIPMPMFADKRIGDADAVFATAAVTVDATYHLPPQHQNPMELIATVAEWTGDILTVREPTQNAEGMRFGLAGQLGIPADNVRVISPTVGGGFGQKNAVQSHSALVAIAARRLGRPVKLVVTRGQLFHAATFRPASVQRIRLAADGEGKLLAAIHDTDQQTSRHDLFPSVGSDMSARLYGIANFRSDDRLVRTDVQTPGYMRAPHEHPSALAFECAIDEMAYAVGKDPVALRLANDTMVDPVSGKPFSSRHLAACLTEGSRRFGWERRAMAPRSMMAADGTMIGWGVAIGCYKASTAPAVARIKLSADGAVRIAVGGHEMGQGMRTAIAMTVAEVLKIPAASLAIVLGETGLVPQHITAGSWGSATVLPPVQEAAMQMMADLRRLGGTTAEAGALALLQASGRPSVEIEVRMRAAGQPEQAFDRLLGGMAAPGGPVYPDFVSYSFIAHFVEVRIEANTRRIRVPRVVSIADCGRVVSPRTARSQVQGGVVWGIGAALREISEVDVRYGGFLNADLAEYVLPVAADIGSIEVGFIDIADPLINTLGVKGLGEVAMVGVAPAIVNAIFHATGKRLRKLPVRIEDLLAP